MAINKSKKAKGTDKRCLRLIEGCIGCRIIRLAVADTAELQHPTGDCLIVCFLCFFYKCLGYRLAVLDEENAENTEKEHDGAVNEE